MSDDILRRSCDLLIGDVVAYNGEMFKVEWVHERNLMLVDASSPLMTTIKFGGVNEGKSFRSDKRFRIIEEALPKPAPISEEDALRLAGHLMERGDA
jgi:hypothetical protein